MLKPTHFSCSAQRGRVKMLLTAPALMLGLLAFAPVKPAAADPPPVAGVTWTPTFCDKFPGTALDQSKWETGYWWVDNNRQNIGNTTNDYFGYYHPGQPDDSDFGFNAGYPYLWRTDFPAVTVDANGLSLRTKKESYTDNKGVPHDYTSGAVQTDRSFAQLYGYFEADYQVALEAGIDSAFWLYTRDQEFSPLPGIVELDVIEVPSAPWYNGAIDTNGDLLSNNVHGATNLANVSASDNANDFIPLGFSLGAASHKYGMDWEEGSIKFYLDGVLKRSLTYTPVSGQRPMFMILNQDLQNDTYLKDDRGVVGQGHWYGDPNQVVGDYVTKFAHVRSVKAWTHSSEAPYPNPTSPPSFPGTVQAANYDTGGQGLSYNQSRTGYSYSYNRPDPSGAAYSANGSTPDGLGTTSTGQWYKYTVNVATSGFYTLSFAANTNNNGDGYTGAHGGRMHLEDWDTATATGKRITDVFDLNSPSANTSNYVPVTVSNSQVHLTAGTHVFRWVQDLADYGDDFSLFSMTATLTQADSGPYDGPHNVPGTIQSDDYDTGGEGNGYHLVPPVTPQAGTGYRADNNTHIYAENAPGGNGYVLGWSGATDWYKYSVNVTATTNYTATFQVQTGGPGGTFHLEDEHGNNLTGTMTAPDTGGWGSAYWKTVTSPAFGLTAGPHTLRLVEDTVVAGGWVCDFSWMQLSVATGALITGTEFDDGAGPWGGNQANVASNAFDGDVSTFYDCNSAYGYVGIDAGVPTTVTSIVYAPRINYYEPRMVGGVFEGSNTSATAGYVTLGTVTTIPTDGLNNTITVTDPTPYRWLRYRDSQGGECNVSEIQFIDPPVGVPAVPVNVKAVAGAAGTKKIALSWGAASGATSYHILRSLASGYTGTRALAVNVTGLSYTDSGLTAGKTYYYKVTAINSKGGTKASAQASAAAK